MIPGVVCGLPNWRPGLLDELRAVFLEEPGPLEFGLWAIAVLVLESVVHTLVRRRSGSPPLAFLGPAMLVRLGVLALLLSILRLGVAQLAIHGEALKAEAAPYGLSMLDTLEPTRKGLAFLVAGFALGGASLLAGWILGALRRPGRSPG
jgi:hypothetical protein